MAYFWSKTYFNSNFLVFTVKEEYFTLSNGDNIEDWISIGLLDKYLNVKGTAGDVILSKPIKPMHLIFSGKGSLVQKQVGAIKSTVINIYIVYKITPKTVTNDFVSKNSLFGAIEITQQSDKKVEIFWIWFDI